MDQVMSARARDDEMGRIAAACGHGFILVDADGQIRWMDDAVRRRVNGELQNLQLPVSRPESAAMDCFIVPVEVTVNGETFTICAIQEATEQKETRDLIAMIEAVMADSTSWFTRTVVEKLKALRHARPSPSPASVRSDLDLLSGREREVLGLICEGRSDAQMSRMLGLSENTVRNHIASLYRKIGVNRRTAAIIWARERGVTCRDELEVKQRRRRSPHRSGDPLAY